MDIYCILWVIIPYYFIPFVGQIFPDLDIGASLVGPCVPLTHSIIVGLPCFRPFLSSFLPFLICGSTGCSRLILYISGSNRRITKSPGSFY